MQNPENLFTTTRIYRKQNKSKGDEKEKTLVDLRISLGNKFLLLDLLHYMNVLKNLRGVLYSHSIVYHTIYRNKIPIRILKYRINLLVNFNVRLNVSYYILKATVFFFVRQI